MHHLVLLQDVLNGLWQVERVAGPAAPAVLLQQHSDQLVKVVLQLGLVLVAPGGGARERRGEAAHDLEMKILT